MHRANSRQCQMTIMPRLAAINQQREFKNVAILTWIVVIFIACQTVIIIPDLYESFYCDHREVNEMLILE